MTIEIPVEPVTDPDHEDAPGAEMSPMGDTAELSPNGDTTGPEGNDESVNSAKGDEVTTTHPEDPETFPREYVEELRKENGKYRQRAQQADDLAKQLHTALVTATGRLQDPTDLDFDEDHIRDAPKLIEAIDALLTAKPHLASRKPTGNIGQGASVVADTFSLAGVLRSNAS